VFFSALSKSTHGFSRRQADGLDRKVGTEAFAIRNNLERTEMQTTHRRTTHEDNPQELSQRKFILKNDGPNLGVAAQLSGRNDCVHPKKTQIKSLKFINIRESLVKRGQIMIIVFGSEFYPIAYVPTLCGDW